LTFTFATMARFTPDFSIDTRASRNILHSPMKTYRQGSLLFPREPIAWKSESNRTIRANPGQSFWVVTPSYEQTRDNAVEIARSGQKTGHRFTLADAEKYFRELA
jgi:hypothetical protein